MAKDVYKRQQGDRYRGTWNGVIGFNLAENYNIAFQERPQFDQMFPAENTWKQSSRKGGVATLPVKSGMKSDNLKEILKPFQLLMLASVK